MSLSTLSDEELIKRWQQQADLKLMTELGNRYQQYVIQQCYYYVRDRETAKDLSQEVFIRVIIRANTYQQRSTFATWLRTITRNCCIDHLKQNKQNLHQELSQQIIDAFPERTEVDNVGKPTVEILEELMEEISREDKLLLLLKYKQRWSIQAIAQIISPTEGAVKMRLSRTKKKLQQLLNQYAVNAPAKKSSTRNYLRCFTTTNLNDLYLYLIQIDKSNLLIVAKFYPNYRIATDIIGQNFFR